MKTLHAFAMLAALALAAGCATQPESTASNPAVAGKTEMLWLGQAGFRIKSPGGKVIVIDPWLRNGPKAPAEFKDPAKLGKVDIVLVTHAHVDHLGDAPEIAKANKVILYGPADMITPLVTLGIMPADLTHRFNKSGSVTPHGLKITAVKAEHSSLLLWNNPATGKNESHPAGEAMGYIIEMENGFKIWHMGDTGLFPDMQFIADYYKPDLVLMPVGGNFTMDHSDAAYAVRTWLKPKHVIPMHYGASPLFKGTGTGFRDALAGTGYQVTLMTEGQTLEF
jgi:L-ascorbate metabolism protein UlaG (beta-lactamase superfamily)